MCLPFLSSLSGGRTLRIFFGFRHQSCSGRMQFQRTQGNHKATPISTVRKMRSWVLRLVRSTLEGEMKIPACQTPMYCI